jgi:arsenate reductase-like glutaredoxin family protein
MADELHNERIPASLSDDVLQKLLHTHNIVDRPEMFAEMFCKIAETQSAVRTKLMEVLRVAIQHDVPTRSEVKKVLKEIYDEDWKRFIRSTGAKIGAVVWTLITLAAGYFFKKYIG